MAQPTPEDHDTLPQPSAAADDSGAPSPRPDSADVNDDVEDAPVEPDWAELAAADPRSKGELLAELAEAESRRDEYLDDVRRARADYENLRKRMMREGASYRDLGRAELAGALLEVLDDFDRTLDAASAGQGQADGATPETPPGLARGVELVYGKLVEALKAQGLARIEDTGAAFDPNRHEAVQQVEAAAKREQPVVAEVLRPGYEIGGRVIRPAMVVVEQ